MKHALYSYVMNSAARDKAGVRKLLNALLLDLVYGLVAMTTRQDSRHQLMKLPNFTLEDSYITARG